MAPAASGIDAGVDHPQQLAGGQFAGQQFDAAAGLREVSCYPTLPEPLRDRLAKLAGLLERELQSIEAMRVRHDRS